MNTTPQQRFDAGDLCAGRFRVVRLLGEGGAAAAYEVRDERSGRRLALKCLMSGAAGGAQAASGALFEREYHTLRQLAHPRVIAVYDYGFDRGSPFYTMELLDGEDMQTLGTQPWRTACALLCDVASCLAIVHSRRLVHRDVSARNVRCTTDGRAKLFDFGALSPMGVAKHVVGTPPYAAPEAVERQGLDGRADLYSLGALAYWVLCGYHAYHARSFGQLRIVWRSPPLPPSQYQPDLPPALDQLVMELLQLDRAGRPTSAAEVMERLSGIAGLPLSELPEVKRSYLVMPSLVGREPQLERIRARLDEVGKTGQGGVISIAGTSGAGRSRLLEASMLEAKLLGFSVLRGDASDSAGGDYGVVRALCAQLWEEAPELCERAAEGREELLAQVLPSLAAQRQQTAPADAEALGTPASRNRFQSALRAFLLAICRRKPLAIGVDDMEWVDEPSAALLGLLAHAARQAPLALIATANPDCDPPPALALIKKLGAEIALPPLSAEDTDALLRSVFGDVEYGSALASRVHGLARGNPRWTMLLAEHLVERGLARYEAGGWILSHDVHVHDLPRTLSDALAERIARLEPDARELAEALALTEPAAVAQENYALLPEHGDQVRTYRALEQLVSHGVLIAEGERYRFGQPELAALLGGQVSEQRARPIHARIARAVAGSEDRLLSVHHMLLGGLERQALEILPGRLGASQTDFQMCSARTVEVLQRALAAAQALGVDRELQTGIERQIVVFAAVRGDLATYSRYAPPLLARLCELCAVGTGADAPRSIEGASTPPRDSRAPGAALPALHAGSLLGVCVAATTMANIAMARELLDALPRTDKLAATTPALSLAQAVVDVSRLLLAGTIVRARRRALDVLELLENTAPGDIEPGYAEYIRFAMLYKLSAFDASSGMSSAGKWLAELQQKPGIRANAARVRMVLDLMQGNSDAANARRQRAELLTVQDGELLVFPGTTARVELIAFILADNLLGVKRLIERIEPMAAAYPGWVTTLSIGRAHYRRLSGDPTGALEALEPALAGAPIGVHMDWGWAAATHVQLTTAIGEHAHALQLANEYEQANRRSRYAFSATVLTQALCEAFANADQLGRAAATVAAAVEGAYTYGLRGLSLGILYETAARIALKQRDRQAFTHWVRLCAKEYRGGSNAMLDAKFTRLLQEADEQELCPAAEVLGQPA